MLGQEFAVTKDNYNVRNGYFPFRIHADLRLTALEQITERNAQIQIPVSRLITSIEAAVAERTSGKRTTATLVDRTANGASLIVTVRYPKKSCYEQLGRVEPGGRFASGFDGFSRRKDDGL